MSNYAISLKRSASLAAAIAMVAAVSAVSLSSIFSAQASAAQLTSRSLELSSTLSGTEVGDSVANSPTNGSDATHDFTFTTTDASVSSVVLTYCTDAIGTCTAPTGLGLSTTSSDGTVVLSDDGGTNNVATITLSAAWVAAGTQTVDLTGVTNPTFNGAVTNPDDNTFFVRITADQDQGTVASSITEGIEITAKVAETLGFSTAAYDGSTAWDAESTSCDALEGSGAIALGDPTDGTLSLTQTYDAYSGFRIYTNAANGVTVNYEGADLAKGSDVIDSMGSTAAANAQGTEQFGLAVNITDPASVDAGNLTGAETDNPGGAGRLALDTQYVGGNTTLGSGTWAFVADTSTAIGTSSTYVTCDTYAVQYIGNIAPTTPAGTYTTTVVYSAVPIY